MYKSCSFISRVRKIDTFVTLFTEIIVSMAIRSFTNRRCIVYYD